MRKVTKTVATQEAIDAFKEQHPALVASIDLAIDVYVPPADEVWAEPVVFPEVEVSNHGNVRDKSDKIHRVPQMIHGEKLFSVSDEVGKHHFKTPQKLKEEAGFEDA